MSRRSRSRRSSSSTAAPASAAAARVPAAAAIPGPDSDPGRAAALAIPAADPAADDLHRIALERRRARMGGAPTDRQANPTAPEPIAAARTTVILPVAGMTCRSCEVRIARMVGRLHGVEKVSASAVAGRVTVETSAPVSRAAIEAAINKAGYEIGATPWLARDPRTWATAAGGVLLVAAIAVVAQVTGITELASGTGDLGSGGLLVALLLGLAAGVSTCAALVGGLVLALSASFQARRSAAGEPDAGFATQMRPALAFVGGRIVGYGLLGALLGAIGATVTMPPQVTAILMVVVAVVMTLLGTRLTGLSPRLAGWSPTLPMGLGVKLGLTDGGGAYSDGRAALLGAASFFLPCGFTQAVQIYALSTGSAPAAGAIMAVFAIGTAPGLLALAGLPVLVPGRARPTLLRLVGVVVIAFAVVNLGAGLRLAGFRLPAGVAAPVAAAEGSSVTATTAAGSGAATVPGSPPSGAVSPARQTLTTYQDAGGYSPADVSIYAGVPTTWTIESSTVRTCAAFLVVPDVGVQMILKEGANTIELPALRAGTLAYSCSMGMYGGQITVVDRPTSMTPTGG